MSITHKKITTQGQTPSSGVTPTWLDWLAEHLAPEFLIMQIGTHEDLDELSTNADPTEYGWRGGPYPVGWYTFFDFSNVNQMRIEIVSGIASSTLMGELRAQYSLDVGVTWNYFDGVSGPRVDVSSAIRSNTVLSGDYCTVGSAAKTDALVRIVSLNSDGNGIVPGTVSIWGR